MSPINTRLSGHELQNEGAGFESRGYQVNRGTGGKGYARCSCGAKSEVLTSGAQRKAWHREHKNTIRKALA